MNIRQVDQSFISYYLRSDKNYANNYVVKNLKNLGKVIHIALVSWWILTDPLLGYNGKSKNVDCYYLNQPEIQHLIDKVFITERLGQYHLPDQT